MLFLLFLSLSLSLIPMICAISSSLFSYRFPRNHSKLSFSIIKKEIDFDFKTTKKKFSFSSSHPIHNVDFDLFFFLFLLVHFN